MTRLNDWATGSAPQVRPATTEDTESVLVVSDLHVPFENKELVESAVRLAKKTKPHRIVVNGDLLDMNEISRFARPSEITLGGLQEQFDAGHKVLSKFRKAAPDAQIEFTVGNHEDRFERFLSNFPPLAGLRSMTLKNQLGLDKLNIRYHDGSGFRLRSNLIVKHGTYVRKYSGWSAKAEMESAMLNGVSGHTHRLNVFTKSGYQSLTWAEGGCLCGLNPSYVVGKPDWQNGCLMIHASTKTTSFVIEPIVALDNKLFWGGKSH